MGWLPPGRPTGQLEPVGTLPGWRRRGVSRTVGRQVLAAFATAGATHALVYARGDDAYPDARATYRSMGFDVHARQHRWQRRLR
jgi:GNAT superfamily N-acetyltransferase